jgi:2-dehydrotetronate isomerase
MLHFAANLSFLYNDVAFTERFAAAAHDGFKGVEYLFPYEFGSHDLAKALKANGLQQVLFNAPPGGTDRASMSQAWEQGVRGTTCLPGHEAEFRSGFLTALEYAEVMNCPRIHVMAGLVPPEMRVASSLPPELSTSGPYARTPWPFARHLHQQPALGLRAGRQRGA